jgi:hypothetical protein
VGFTFYVLRTGEHGGAAGHTHIHIHTHTYTHTHIHTCTHIHIHTHTHTNVPGNMVVPPDMTMLAYRSLRMSTSHFMMVCVCVCVCVWRGVYGGRGVEVWRYGGIRYRCIIGYYIIGYYKYTYLEGAVVDAAGLLADETGLEQHLSTPEA